MSKMRLETLRKRYGKASFTTKQAISSGLDPRMINYYLGKGQLKRIGRGIYAFADYDIDEDFQYSDLVIEAKRFKDSVICLISALSWWDMTDEIARDFWLALPNNYPIPDDKKIKFIRPVDLKTGVIKVKIAGQQVRITTPERSVCEAFKHLDEESAITALKYYLEKDDVQLDKLLETAQKLKAAKLLKIIKDVTISQAKEYPSMDDAAFKVAINWFSNRKTE